MAAGTITKVSTPRKQQRYQKKVPEQTKKYVKTMINRNVDKEEQYLAPTTGTIIAAGLVKDLATFTTLGSGSIAENIYIDSFNMRFYVTNVTNANQVVRHLVVYWKNPGVSCTLGNIVSGSGVNAQILLESPNFDILYDKTFNMNLFNKSSYTINIPYLKKCPKILKYDEAGTGSNQGLYLISISTVDTNTTQSAISVRVRYHLL